MRICSVFGGAVLAAASTFTVVPANAFDPANLSEQTPPDEAFRYGVDAYYNRGDKSTAFEALRIAAEKGHPQAQWKLGRMYADGDGVERNDAKAFELFSEIASAHADDDPAAPSAAFVSNAFVEMGSYFRDGIPNRMKPDYNRARRSFAYAASYFGDPVAQFSLARMFYEGEGGTRDPHQAAKWANLAAAKGNAGAQALLARILFEGDGVGRNPAHAAYWSRLAAEKGDVEAQAVYGYLLFEGDGVPQDAERGLGLLTAAFLRGERLPGRDFINRLHEQAMSVATDSQRRTALAFADDWMKERQSAQR